MQWKLLIITRLFFCAVTFSFSLFKTNKIFRPFKKKKKSGSQIELETLSLLLFSHNKSTQYLVPKHCKCELRALYLIRKLTLVKCGCDGRL